MKSTSNRTCNESQGSSLQKVCFRPHPAIRRTAEILQEKAEKLSARSKWLGLVLFCLLSIGCSVGVIMYSVRTHHSFFSVEPIRLPVPLTSPHRLSGSKDSLVTAAQYERIRRVESYLSQQKDPPSTKILYDSLLKARPHFLDSLRMIDSLFLSQ